jgi:hypothetical protein
VRKPGSADSRGLFGRRQRARPEFLTGKPVARWHLAALAYGTFSLFGLAVVALSDQPVHRLWGGCAAVAYACAALTSLVAARMPGRRATEHALTMAVMLGVAGALLVPLCWLAATGQGMPEVWVVAHSAESLVTHGRPYQPAAQLGGDVYGYDPYLPGMILFGLPRALFGGFATDPRLWDALAFVVAFAAALRIGGSSWATALRRTAILASSPLVAFPLAVSGNDLPVIGLLCLGLALASRPALAGLTLGAAASLKATAWPALLIVAVLLAVTDGRRASVRFTATAVAVLAAIAGPFLLLQPADLIANTIAFPLGLTKAHSPAASPLPGHLIAATGQAGHVAVIVLMAATAVALLIALVVQPPKTAAAAAAYLALILTALFSLAPATRWGYFTYPALIACWLWLSPSTPTRAANPFRQRAPRPAQADAPACSAPPTPNSDEGMSDHCATMVRPGLPR